MKVITANLLNRFWTNGVKPIKTAVGTISSLTTAAKTNLVAAINEVKAKADSNATEITSLNNNLDKTKIRIYVAYASITVQANSQRTFTYDYSASLVDANIVTNIPVIEWNGLGITVGRSFDDNSTIYLWNNTSTTKDVPVYNMIFYTRK